MILSASSAKKTLVLGAALVSSATLAAAKILYAGVNEVRRFAAIIDAQEY
jgi:hypothetical protein